jgi:hypothetical protein
MNADGYGLDVFGHFDALQYDAICVFLPNKMVQGIQDCSTSQQCNGFNWW